MEVNYLNNKFYFRIDDIYGDFTYEHDLKQTYVFTLNNLIGADPNKFLRENIITLINEAEKLI